MIEIEEAGRLIARELDHLDGRVDPSTYAAVRAERTVGTIGALFDEDSWTAPEPTGVGLDEVLEILRYLRAEEEREAELVRGAVTRADELGVGVAVVRHPDGALTAGPVAVVPAGQAVVVNGHDLPPWTRWPR